MESLEKARIQGQRQRPRRPDNRRAIVRRKLSVSWNTVQAMYAVSR